MFSLSVCSDPTPPMTPDLQQGGGQARARGGRGQPPSSSTKTRMNNSHSASGAFICLPTAAVMVGDAGSGATSVAIVETRPVEKTSNLPRLTFNLQLG